MNRSIYLTFITLLVASCISSGGIDSDGSYSGFSRHVRTVSESYSYKRVSAPEHPVREGSTSFRFELRDGDCANDDCTTDRERVERREIGSSQVGREYWYSYSIYLDPSFRGLPRSGTTLGQFKQEPVAPPIIDVKVYGNDIFLLVPDLSTKQYTSDSGGVKCCYVDRKIATVSANKGKWLDIVMNIKWSTGGDGFIDLYLNGKKNYSYKGRTAFDDNDPISFRYGIYRGFLSRDKKPGVPLPTQIVYYDNVKRGQSYEDVKP